MKYIDYLKQRWKGHKETVFLNNYGCKTWREYELKYDNDIHYGANTVLMFYKGYPHLVWFDPLEFDSIQPMQIWCEQNCKSKWRNEWIRGYLNHLGDFRFDGIGGEDRMYFAFQDSEEATAFILVWK